MKLNISEIEKRIETHMISKVKHPSMDLYILNYTRECQYSGLWDEYTSMCRGIIVDSDYNVLYRPFEKFFNYEEIQDKSVIPNLPFEAFEKLDGSLGILYFDDAENPCMATRGSFSSDQAIHATEILREKYIDACKNIDRSKTYLFEIIYPENHIVVNYGETDDVFLLAVIDTETGVDEDLRKYENVGFNVVKRYDGVDDYLKIREIFDGENKEGFVIKFSNGFRMKLKFAEYFRIHSLLCGVSEKKIFQLFSSGDEDSISELINNLDEENSLMVRNWIEGFIKEYRSVYSDALSEYKDFDNDKDAALYFNTCRNRALLFNIRKGADEKHINESIWKIISKKHGF